MSSRAEGTPFPRYLGANNDDVNISNSGRNPVPFSPLSRFSANGVGFGERLLRNRERNLPGIDHSQSQGSKSSSFSSQGSKSSSFSLSSLIFPSIFQQIRRLCISLHTGVSEIHFIVHFNLMCGYVGSKFLVFTF